MIYAKKKTKRLGPLYNLTVRNFKLVTKFSNLCDKKCKLCYGNFESVMLSFSTGRTWDDGQGAEGNGAHQVGRPAIAQS